MNRLKTLKYLYWGFFIATILMFLYSLRYSLEYKVYTTSAALVLWGVSFLINRQIKRHKKGGKD